MTPEGIITRDDFRDALGWMYAVLHGDTDAKTELARACDPAGMVEAMATLYASLIVLNTCGEPARYLDYLRDNLDTMLDDGTPE